MLKKIVVEKDSFLFSKTRILDGQRMQVAAGLEDLEFLNNFKPFTSGITLICPVIDRFSPTGFAIAKYIHDNVYPYRGYESSFRLSMDYVYILEGLKLFREIGEECVTCKSSEVNI